MNQNTCKPVGLSSAGRIYKMLFKRKFELAGPVEHARINLGASGLYKLVVNGNRVGDGPCRSYPEFAEYDSYSLETYLVAGANEIIVEVLYHNVNSFHQLKTEPFFYADGLVDQIKLDTPGEWLAALDMAEANDSPNYSFAIGPVQFRDERKGLTEWLPVIPADSSAPAVPRLLPQLTERELVPEKIVMNSVKNDSTLYSYTMVDTAPANNSDQFKDSPDSSICSWFYSPVGQEIECECWWGRFFLNEQELSPRNAEGRQYITLPVDMGWNFFEAVPGFSMGKWEFALNIPDNARLMVNADQIKKHTKTFHLYRRHGSFPEKCVLSGLTGSPFMDLCWAGIDEVVKDIPSEQSRLIQVDMGKITLGRIFIELEGPAGTVVNVGYSEQLKNGRVDYRKNVLVHASERWITKAGKFRLETFNRRGFRYLEILIQGHSAPVKIEKIGVMENVYPYNHIGCFECSDDDFNTLWKYGERTLELCSEDVITDCPWRERTLYGGDMLAGMGTMLSVDRDLRLIKRSVDLFLQSFNSESGWLQSMVPVNRERTPLYEYPMLCVITMEWYCRLTSDIEFIDKWKHVLDAMLKQFLSIRTDEGLYQPPHPAFIMHGYPLNDKASLAFNACGVQFLRSIASLLDKIEADNAANILEQIIMEKLLNHETGAFYDAQDHIEPINCAGNAWNVFFTNCWKGHESAILNVLREKLASFSSENEVGCVSPYNMFYLLGALYKLNAEDVAEEAVRKVYANMLSNPTGTIWEQSFPDKSLCHVWSTAPNHYFSTCVLGVKQDNPEKIVIAPQADSIRWAKGVVPHPLGNVAVSWEVTGNILRLQYSVPENCPVEVKPRGRLAKLYLEVNNSAAELLIY